jgi:hypothetical protein
MRYLDLPEETRLRIKEKSCLLYSAVSPLKLDYCPCNSVKYNWASLRYLAENGKTTYFVKCMACDETGQEKDTVDEAIKAWNAEILLLTS